MIRRKMSEAEAALFEAEQSALGAALLNKQARLDVTGHITSAADFHDVRHGTIWEAIRDLADAGEPVDAMTVAARLADTGQLRKVGGGPYLHDLMEAVPVPGNGGYYAKKVAEAARRREFQTAAIEISQYGNATGESLAAVVERSRAALDGIGRSGDWPDPIPLTDHTDLPAFPTMVLPEWLERMVTGVAEATQTPPDLAAAMALAALSAAIQGKVFVKVKPGWTEMCVLYLCVALDPGNRKTSVFDAMVRYPIGKVERELAEELRPKIIEAATEAEILRRAADDARTKAAKNAADPDMVNEAKRAALEAEECIVPAEPKLFVDDVTPEIVKTLMARNGGALAVLSDEGGLFQSIAGRYSGIPDLDVFLKGHTGGEIRVERKTSGSERIENAALTIGLSPQPAVLRDAAAMPGFEDRGLLARFLFAMPTSTVGHRKHNPAPVTERVVDEYARRIAALVHAGHATAEPTTVELTSAAQARVVELEADREPRLAPGGEWEPILSWANKWTGAVVRIAALLHLAEHGFKGRYEPIDVDTIDAAALIGHYYADHALAVWAYMGATPEAKPAAELLEWLAANATPGMTIREIYRGVRGRNRLSTSEKLRAALAVLEDHGWARRRPHPPGKAGRPSPKFDFHPKTRETGGLA